LPVGVDVSEQSDQHGSPFQAAGWTEADSLAPDQDTDLAYFIRSEAPDR
jgi:hypothetical protein